jgi:hypothetical protein
MWIDRIEQRVIVKYFFLKGHRSKLIHTELVGTLQDDAISVSTEFQSLLTILANRAEKTFQGIITGDESWFSYLIESEAVFTSSLAEVAPWPDSQFRAKSHNDASFQGKRPTDFGFPTERIQIQSGLFY